MTLPICALVSSPARVGKWGDFFDGLKALYAKLQYGSHESGERKNEFSYRARNLPIRAIGLNFDSKTCQLTGAVCERLQ